MRSLKKAVWQFRFSHPVDAAKLESALRSRMFDGAGRVLPSPALSTQVNARKLDAWVHSAPLELPPNGGQVFLDVGKGITSVLGGPGSTVELSQKVDLPALYSVTVDDLSPTLVEEPGKDPIQVIVVGFNSAMKDTDVVAATRAWVLPEKNPKLKDSEQSIPYQWSEGEIDEALLKASTPLALKADPAEREWLEIHSFKYQAPVGRRIYVRVDKGLKSFGGFILGQPHAVALTVPEYPRLLSFVGEGALLSLRGERRVTVVARNMPKIRLEVGRVVPEQLHHLVQFNEGSYGHPELWTIGEDSLVERMEKRVVLPAGDPAKTVYEGIDLGEFFTGGKHGVFLLSLRTLSDYEAEQTPDWTIANDSGETMDARLVVLTDLGIVAKKTLDGSREVFVQSLASGTAVSGARVRVLARNGETLAAADTDAMGRASLPPLDGFVREKSPVAISVTAGDDLSFLPLNSYDRALDLSRFDIGGDANETGRRHPEGAFVLGPRAVPPGRYGEHRLHRARGRLEPAAGGHSAGSGVLRSARQRGEEIARVAGCHRLRQLHPHAAGQRALGHLAGHAVPDRRGGLAHHDRRHHGADPRVPAGHPARARHPVRHRQRGLGQAGWHERHGGGREPVRHPGAGAQGGGHAGAAPGLPQLRALAGLALLRSAAQQRRLQRAAQRRRDRRGRQCGVRPGPGAVRRLHLPALLPGARLRARQRAQCGGADRHAGVQQRLPRRPQGHR